MFRSGVYTGDTTNLTMYLALAALALLFLIIIIFLRRRRKHGKHDDSYHQYDQ